MSDIVIVDDKNIQNRISNIRDKQIMLDRDLSELYQVKTKVLNQAVKRNIDRFPEDFMFQLSKEEFENWRSQFVTSNNDKMGLRRPPYSFTEQGISMLASVLKSKIAVEVSIKIIRTFVNMREFLSNNMLIFQRFDYIEQKLLKHDENFDRIFKALENKSIKPKQHIFYDGQIFDAYLFISDIIKSAKKSIILIDNYIDESVLILFAKRDANIRTTIYTKNITQQLQLDLKKYNKQYPKIEIKEFNLSHDRFLIIDGKEVYHIGASLKDLGKKWFAFSKMDIDSFEIIGKLK